MEKKHLVLCDTNIFIEIYRGNETITQNVEKIGIENIVVSDVILAELLFGARNKKELQFIKKDLSQFVQLPIKSSISKEAVKLVDKYSISHKLSFADALIAATVLYFEMPLYTLNIKDFKFIEGIELFMI